MYPSPYDECLELPSGMVVCFLKPSQKKQAAQAEAQAATDTDANTQTQVTAATNHAQQPVPTLLQRLNPVRLVQRLWTAAVRSLS